MSIDERLASTSFPLPAIRQVNMAKHETSISLGLGELKDFEVDQLIIDSIKQAVVAGGANYTANAGLPALRSAIAFAQRQVDGFEYNVNNVVVTIGVQNAMYASIKALAKLGVKRVLIPEINFGIYKKIPAEFNLDVKTYKLTDDFGIDIDFLKEQLNSDDVIIINSPSNPTGRVFSEKEQIELAKLFNQSLTNGYVISDEIYGKLVYDGEPYTSFSKYFERTIVLNGISKSAAAAGLRVGWIITRNEKLAQAFTSNNATIISCPPTLNQYAAIPVVEGRTNGSIENYNRVLLANRKLVVKFLENNNISFIEPRGSFYIFPKIKQLIGEPVKEFCIKIAKQENGVVVIPGEAFGSPDHVRISLASNEIEEGMKRFINAIK